jgi:CHAT domain-containing protein/tetratricopeptide (TPR) repeat protein
MKDSSPKKFNYQTVVFLFLLALLLTTTAMAQNNGVVRSGNGALPPPQSAQNPKPIDVPEIKQGETIERELTTGDTHRFRITLKAGEYVKLAVLSSSIDFAMAAFDLSGNAIARIALGNGGPTESLWMLAKTTGDFQIRVTSLQDRGAKGRYVIKLETVADLKTASTSDQAYLKAHQLFWEATQLGDQGGDQRLRQAAEKYQEVLLIWRTLGDRLGEASTLHLLGFAHDRLGELQKGADLYEQALSIWRTFKNHQHDEANTLYSLGGIYSYLGKAAEATNCFEQAIQLQRLRGSKGGEAYAQSNLGQVYTNVSEFQAALKAYQEALRLRIEIDDVEGQARLLSNISGVYFRLGEFQEALNYCKQALPLRRATGDRMGEAVTLSNIGSNYRELGEPQKALEYYQQAVSLQQGKAGQINDAAILDGIGRAYYDLGNYPKALDYQNQSLSIRRLINDRYGEGASLAGVGSSYARLGDRQKAVEYFEQSLQLRRAIGDRRGEAFTLRNAGELYRESGDQKKALAYFNDGLALSRTIKNRFAEANLLYDIARVEQTAGHFDQARAQVEGAIAIIESTRSSVASTDLRASLLASKQDFYELEIDLLMQSDRGDRNQVNLAKAFGISEQRRARSLLDSLAQARASIHRVVSPELLTHERGLRAKLDQKAENQIKLLSGKHTLEQAASLAKEVDAVSLEYEQVLTEITVSDPHYAALTQSAPLSLAEVQKEILDPDTLLLEYSLGSERSYLWAVTPTEINAYELPSRKEIETQAHKVYDLLTARNRFINFEEPPERQVRIAKADAEFFSAAGRLSDVLLGPIAAKLSGKRLLIVSEGALQYLPFASLPPPVASLMRENEQTTRKSYRPLVIDHEITNLPSASILGVLRREAAGRRPAPKTVAVLADPVFSKTDERVMGAASMKQLGDQRANSHQAVRSADDLDSELVRAVRDVGGENGLEIDRLPSTRQEAEAILRLIPKSERFVALDFLANRAAATSPELSQYRIVHFATHGLLNATHPELSGLILSLVDRQGKDQNGFLPTQAVFDLNLPADLVVLSGCRTGLGKEIKGEGMLGLTRGFMYAGATRVAVSLWDVSDKSTAELMALFYRGMLGKKSLSPAAALREAQIAMWKTRGRGPYYWAAFVLEGEYR